MPPGIIVPCLWFDDQAEEAARLYTQIFQDGRVTAVSRYPASSDNPSGKPRGSVMTVEFEIAGQGFTALNGGPYFKINPSISFFAQTTSREETDRIFHALADGGTALMPLDAYPWSDRFGWVQDRFGVSWQVMLARDPGGAVIVPCLMFTGAQAGRAGEAMEFYAGVFPDGRVVSTSRYVEGEGPTGWIKHGRFLVAGHLMSAMDNPSEHVMPFTEGLSLQVLCEDQSEVDRYWSALSNGGAEGPCGWLKDKFGLSWQVVPRAMSRWIACDDGAARDRAFQAMLGMKKLDIAALDAALRGSGALGAV